jgi:hypothetical protein
LLKIYAKCLDGQDAIAKRRIEEALGDPGAEAARSPARHRKTRATRSPDKLGRVLGEDRRTKPATAVANRKTKNAI